MQILQATSVDTLKAGSVETDSLVVNSVTKKQFWQDNWSAISSSSLGALSDDVWYDFGLSTNKARTTFFNAYDGGEVSLKWFVNLQRTGGDNDRVWFRVMRSFNGGAFTQVGDILRAGMGNFPMMLHYEWIDTGLATGSYDYKVQFYRDEGVGSYYSAKLIVDLGFR